MTRASLGHTGRPLTASAATQAIYASIIIAAVTALCYKGIKESAGVNTVIVAIKVSIVVAVIAFGARFVDTHNWVPYIPKNTGNFGEFGWSGIFQRALKSTLPLRSDCGL